MTAATRHSQNTPPGSTRRRSAVRTLVLTTAILLASAALIAALGWSRRHRILHAVTTSACAYLAEGIRIDGVEVRDPQVESSLVRSPRRLEWTGIQTTVRLASGDDSVANGTWRLALGKVELELTSPLRGSGRVTVKDATLTPHEDWRFESETRAGQRVRIHSPTLVIRHASLPWRLGRWSYRQLRRTLAECADILTTWRQGQGVDIGPELEGRLHLEIQGREADLGLRTVVRDRRTYLVTSQDDVRDAADLFGDPLTEAETELAADYPLRIPRLLEIRNRAVRTAAERFPRRVAAHQDAHRHMLWSYLLSAEYGTEFAEKVTDAHELGSSNTAAESRKDLANNALGRSLYTARVPVGNLADLVEDEDPRVALNPIEPGSP